METRRRGDASRPWCRSISVVSACLSLGYVNDIRAERSPHGRALLAFFVHDGNDNAACPTSSILLHAVPPGLRLLPRRLRRPWRALAGGLAPRPRLALHALHQIQDGLHHGLRGSGFGLRDSRLSARLKASGPLLPAAAAAAARCGRRTWRRSGLATTSTDGFMSSDSASAVSVCLRRPGQGLGSARARAAPAAGL